MDRSCGRFRYHAGMNAIPRLLIAASLLAAVCACGNKGPLVQADAPAADEAPATETQPATTPADPATAPTVEENEPAPADPAEPPVPAEDDGTP